MKHQISHGTAADVVERFRRCLGPLPKRCGLDAQIVRSQTIGPWHGQWLRFRSEPDEWVTAILVRPEGVEKPPVVICNHGYGGSKEQSLFSKHIGRPRHPQEPEAALTKWGVAVLGIDARCCGERLAAGDATAAGVPDPEEEPDAWDAFFEAEWQWLARRCLVDGTCLQALLIHDVQCAIDYLETRSDVDAERVGLYGYSQGGTSCWSTAVVEPRIRAAAVGGCLINYDTALRVRRDASWHAWVPGARRVASREELVASIAPRPLLAVHGEDDFPRDGVQPILDAAAASYAEHHCPEHFRSVFLPGDHLDAARNPELIREVGRWFEKYL